MQIHGNFVQGDFFSLFFFSFFLKRCPGRFISYVRDTLWGPLGATVNQGQRKDMYDQSIPCSQIESCMYMWGPNCKDLNCWKHVATRVYQICLSYTSIIITRTDNHKNVIDFYNKEHKTGVHQMQLKTIHQTSIHDLVVTPTFHFVGYNINHLI